MNSPASTPSAPFVVSTEDRATLDAWLAPRAPWGFSAWVGEIEKSQGEVVLVFVPGHDEYFVMVTLDDPRGPFVIGAGGEHTPVEDLDDALDEITRMTTGKERMDEAA